MYNLKLKNTPLTKGEASDQLAFKSFVKSLIKIYTKYKNSSITGYSVPAAPLEQFKAVTATSLKNLTLILILPLLITSCSFFKKEFATDVNSSSFERTKEDTARIWFSPFIDASGNQHEASYVNIVTKSSSWQETKEVKEEIIVSGGD